MAPPVSQIVCRKPQGKKRETSITILPEGIIFNILILLPAHVLYNVVRYVCRQWHSIIEDSQFVSTHFMLASSTLLMHSPMINLYHILDVRECHAKLSGIEFQIPSSYCICTCNGLMLIRRKVGLQPNCAHYVGNPITRRMLTLPRLPLPIVSCGIAFEASSKVYKVVVVYRTDKWSSKPFNPNLGCAIVTVGIDKAWRFLNCEHLKKRDMKVLNRIPPITSTDLVCWVHSRNPYILALDLKSESIKRISVPFAYEGTQYFNFLAKGNSISVWYPKSDFSMEVWVLKDYISGEWVKILDIDGKSIRNGLGTVMPPDELSSLTNPWLLIPRSWNGDKILFDAAFHTTHLFVYDLKTSGFYQFVVEYGESFSTKLQPFVNSLTWV